MFEGEVDETFHEREVDAGARRVVGKRDDDDARLDARPLPRFDQSTKEVVTGIVGTRPGVNHRHGDDVRTGETRTGQVNRITRRGHDGRVARTE